MLLGAWWVLPAALQQWSSKLLNHLLFIPEQSGTKRWPCIIFCFPSDPDADAGAGVAGGYTQMWHHPRTCCAAGDGCAASRAASSLSLQVLGETFSWQVRRALLLSAPSYLGAYLCCKQLHLSKQEQHFDCCFITQGMAAVVQRAFTLSRGSDCQSSVPGTSFILLTLILKYLSKIKK